LGNKRKRKKLKKETEDISQFKEKSSLIKQLKNSLIKIAWQILRIERDNKIKGDNN
jgi:hypothetical protein